MSLDHILLGMLEQPSSGYDLGKQFAEGPVYFWAAELSQIYPSLRRMADSGWLRRTSAPPDKGPSKVVYERTPAGTAELTAWLRSDPVVRTERLAHIGQLIFMGQVDDLETTREFLKRLQQYYDAQLDVLESALRHVESADAVDPEEVDTETFHELLCVQMGVATLSARVQAIARARNLVQRRMERASAHA